MTIFQKKSLRVPKNSLSQHVGRVAELPEPLRQQRVLPGQRLGRLLQGVVHAVPHRVVASEQGAPARAAVLLRVEGAEDHPGGGQGGQVRGEDVRVRPGDVVVAWMMVCVWVGEETFLEKDNE